MKKGYSQKRNRFADQIDFQDAIFMAQRAHSPIVYCEPAPISKHKEGKYKGHDKINPHVSRFYHTDGQITDIFHQKPVYYLHQNGGWRPLSEVAYRYGRSYVTLKEDWDKQMDLRYLAWLMQVVPSVQIPSPFKTPLRLSTHREHNAAHIAFSVSTFYPAAGNNSPCDGYVENSTAVGASWATLRSALAGTGADATPTDTTLTQISRQDANNKQIKRGFALFDTAAIADSDTVTAGVISYYDAGGSTSQPLNGSSHSIVICQSNPALTSTLAVADFDTASNTVDTPTEGGTRVDFSSYIGSATYKDLTLNATGRGFISKTGISKFGFRPASDVDNVEPTAQAGAYSGWRVYNADYTGTSRDPKLVVTHAPPFTPRFAVIM